ncbi:MAG: 2-C-methyl-D-erythritol 4-phosphate cytidylyltransferase [Terriglobia bacterium]
MSVIAIIPAAGIGSRMGHGTPKQFLALGGIPIFIHTLMKFDRAKVIDEVLLGVRRDELENVRGVVSAEIFSKPVRVLEGGGTRQETVARALAQVSDGAEVIVVHDAVRPFITPAMIEKIVAAARIHGGAIFAIPSVDTVKQLELESVTGTLPRERIALAQTPQAFRYTVLHEAFDRALADGFQGTDESSLVERLGSKVKALMGSDRNIKITKPSDLPLAELFIKLEAHAPKNART